MFIKVKATELWAWRQSSCCSRAPCQPLGGRWAPETSLSDTYSGSEGPLKAVGADHSKGALAPLKQRHTLASAPSSLCGWERETSANGSRGPQRHPLHVERDSADGNERRVRRSSPAPETSETLCVQAPGHAKVAWPFSFMHLARHKLIEPPGC